MGRSPINGGELAGRPFEKKGWERGGARLGMDRGVETKTKKIIKTHITKHSHNGTVNSHNECRTHAEHNIHITNTEHIITYT